jgi:hypothetical protein
MKREDVVIEAEILDGLTWTASVKLDNEPMTPAPDSLSDNGLLALVRRGVENALYTIRLEMGLGSSEQPQPLVLTDDMVRAKGNPQGQGFRHRFTVSIETSDGSVWSAQFIHGVVHQSVRVFGLTDTGLVSFVNSQMALSLFAIRSAIGPQEDAIALDRFLEIRS